MGRVRMVSFGWAGVLWTGQWLRVAQDTGCCEQAYRSVWLKTRAVVNRPIAPCGSRHGLLWTGQWHRLARDMGCCEQASGTVWLKTWAVVNRPVAPSGSRHGQLWTGQCLAQDAGSCEQGSVWLKTRAVVNTAVILDLRKTRAIYWLSKHLVGFKDDCA